MSRIYYRGALFDYPLQAMNALRNLGLTGGRPLRGLLRRGRACGPPKDQSHFEGWVSARFGWRLYSIFFKTYTEKVWGMPADRAAGRLGRSADQEPVAGQGVLNALLPRRNQKDVTSLIEEFQYPKFGPGMMWERCAELVRERRRRRSRSGTWVTAVHRDPERRRAIAVSVDGAGRARARVPADHVVSSMPISDLVRRCDPPAPPEVLACAADLRYRDFLTVALVVPEEFSFPDNWIYIHDPAVKVGRIQNFGSWSPYLVKDGRTCLGLEYFVFEDDEMWRTPTTTWSRWPPPSWSSWGWSGRARSSPATWCGCRRPTPCTTSATSSNVDTIRAWLAEERAQRSPGRAQRHAPLQQPGPLDDDRDADRREHRSRQPVTTSGRSTSRWSTARRNPQAGPGAPPPSFTAGPRARPSVARH